MFSEAKVMVPSLWKAMEEDKSSFMPQSEHEPGTLCFFRMLWDFNGGHFNRLIDSFDVPS